MTSAQALTLADRAAAQARALPPLLVEAERIAATVILGEHGHKRAGPGESFWQYRPYSFGDSTQLPAGGWRISKVIRLASLPRNWRLSTIMSTAPFSRRNSAR